MRIIAGQFKGRRLRTVDSKSVRSTADRVKESLFNILAGELPGAAVLDLFCGAGTLGLEALSRGAEFAVFVDQQHAARSTTERNIETLQIADQTRVLKMDAIGALSSLATSGRRFSVIFADPPYGQGWPSKTLAAVARANCRVTEGILVIEHHKKDPPGDSPPGFSLWTSRRFGDTVFTIWRWAAEGEIDAETQPS
jgi:16S rRNA (guanine(966)-N(2))-methyltransferase RsmD